MFGGKLTKERENPREGRREIRPLYDYLNELPTTVSRRKRGAQPPVRLTGNGG